MVQEWVDFDFELRLFFFPPEGWRPPTVLDVRWSSQRCSLPACDYTVFLCPALDTGKQYNRTSVTACVRACTDVWQLL
eukprot:SAG31_NODE_3316_length_4425_cov_3.196024_6_plen_78_part_00